jgi:hypothetical protein
MRTNSFYQLKYFLLVGILTTTALAIPTPTGIQPSGSGTESNPYLIDSLPNLAWVMNLSSPGAIHLLQTQNIDAAETHLWTLSVGQGGQTIGNFPNEPFNGVYDGGGHVIQNLLIRRNAPISNVALFAYAHSATIKNLGLVNVEISGGNYSAGLVANVSNSIISNCFVTGKITGQDYVGGLAAQTSVTGDPYLNQMIITDSYTSVDISGKHYLGGLVGQHNYRSLITRSYSTGVVKGKHYVGGLLGRSNYYARINNSYSLTRVMGQLYAGGLTGESSVGRTDSSYTAGYVHVTLDTAGALFGKAGPSDSIRYCYWNQDIHSWPGIYYSRSSVSNDIVGNSQSQMLEQGNFSYLDFQSIWNIHEGQTYPWLRNLNNAPFAMPDTLRSSGNEVSILDLMVNDYDDFTPQNELIFKLDSISTSGILSNTSIILDAPLAIGDTVDLFYRVGESRPIFNDTLWGNSVHSILCSSESPVQILKDIGIREKSKLANRPLNNYNLVGQLVREKILNSWSSNGKTRP